MKFVSQLYTGRYLLLTEPKLAVDRVQVEYRFPFATVAAPWSEDYPFHYLNVVTQKQGLSTSVVDTADARLNDIHGLPVGGRDVRNSSNSFALR